MEGDELKIAILTMFNGLSNTYSLVNVVREQLHMLLDHGISVKMLVSESCPEEERRDVFLDERVEWVKIINKEQETTFRWVTYTKSEDKIEEGFYHQAGLIAADFVKQLQDVDVCILHDILYQGVHLVHNVALREAQKQLPRVRFLAFTHSAPAISIEASYPISCMYTEMPNTTFVYPTRSGLEAIAKQYHTQVSRCACVNNSVDVLTGMHEETVHLSQYCDFCKSELLMVYPGRLNMAKRFHVVAEFAGYLKKYGGKTVTIIFCDFPSGDISPEMYKFLIKDVGEKNGLEKEEIIFTSDCGFPQGVKRETVLDLFSLSNLFICPSYSESFGLTVMEAASKGNYMVLNEAVPALEEVGKSIHAYFMRWSAKNFGYDTYETYQPTKRVYYIEHVQNILRNMECDPAIYAKTVARMRYSNEWIYEHQLKPLLFPN
ncbi:MAG: glycosyltransferase [Lachnospiraceae bacterium]